MFWCYVPYQKFSTYKINVIMSIFISLHLPKHHAIVSNLELTPGVSLSKTH